jgi:hypothetical protein
MRLVHTTLTPRPPRSAQSRRRAVRIARRLVQRDPIVRRAHARWRVGLLTFLSGSDVATLVTAPVVYTVVLPVALLDLSVTLYQAICFRAWGIARVRRARYLVIDRHKLAYLNLVEKLNCLYCSYTNGVFEYVSEVAARTEQYWCPIKHARTVRHPHGHYHAFVEYGDAAGYRGRMGTLRQRIRAHR